MKRALQNNQTKFTRNAAAACCVLFLITCSVGLTGCTLLSYTEPSGEQFSRFSVGANTSISGLVVESGTNGVRRVELRGCQGDSTQALGVVTGVGLDCADQS